MSISMSISMSSTIIVLIIILIFNWIQEGIYLVTTRK
jgi:hypothetical protein